MSRADAFALVSETQIPEIASLVRRYRHRSTGAEVLSIQNDDPVSAFGIAFRTPPPDDTGVTHILEHCVLSGSRRYPVRKPFVEMLKGSLQCYLNASTLPDLTLYPVASAHPGDFNNLLDVYLDAVFFPLLTDDTFRQEAWRRELAEARGASAITGVVLNEMRGALSSPLGLLDDLRRRTLFPDTAYARCYGGDPDRIVDLDPARLREFHRASYHAGNALAVFSGRDDPAARLERMGAVLDRAPTGPAVPAPARQPQFSSPRRHTAGYPGSPGGDSYDAVSWILPSGSPIAFEVLDALLIGTPDAPFRRLWTERGWPGVPIPPGFHDETAPPGFSLCLRSADLEGTEDRVLLALRHLARQGFDTGEVEAAIATVGMRRAIRDDPIRPEGVGFVTAAATAWGHGASPESGLHFAGICRDLSARVAAGEPVFETLVETALIDNPHRVTLTLSPDPDLAGRADASWQRRLSELDAHLTGAGRDALAAETARHAASRSRSDPPAALAGLPTLSLSDLERHRPAGPLDVTPCGPDTVLFHARPTRGMAYLDLGFDVGAVPTDFLPFVPLLGHALIEFGTRHTAAARFATRIARETGGIEPRIWCGTGPGGAPRARLFLRGAVRADRMADLAAILREALLEPDLSEPGRLLRLVEREIARVDGALVPRGHETLDRLLRAQMHSSGVIEEAMAGTRYLRALREMGAQLRRGDPAPVDTLRDIHRRVIRRDGIVAALTAEPEWHASALDTLKHILNVVPEEPVTDRTNFGSRPEPIAIPQPVPTLFVGRGLDISPLRAGSVAAAVMHLTMTWLWEEVRERGGAYGAQCRWDPLSGLLRFVSYRDPNLLATLDAFDACASRLDAPVASDALSRCIIGAIGALDRPRHPRADGLVATTDWLQGVTHGARAAQRHQLLDTTDGDLRAVADALRAASDQRHVAVIGPRPSLDRALEARPGLFRIAEDTTGW